MTLLVSFGNEKVMKEEEMKLVGKREEEEMMLLCQSKGQSTVKFGFGFRFCLGLGL